MGRATTVVIGLAQLALLAVVCQSGYLLADLLRLPLPGNLVGMVLMLLLLGTGVVKLAWIDRTASLLLKHLAFFFIPIAVGIIGLGAVLRSSGLLLLAVLVASAAAGIIAAGWSAQAAARAHKRLADAGASRHYLPADDTVDRGRVSRRC